MKKIDTILDYMKAVGYVDFSGGNQRRLAERLLRAGELTNEDVIFKAISPDTPIKKGKRRVILTTSGKEKLSKMANEFRHSATNGGMPWDINPEPTPEEKTETAAAELDEKAAEKSKIYEIALKTIDDLKQKVAKMENEVLFAKSVKASEDCINVSMMARILFMNGVDTSERKLFTWLRDNGWLEEVGGIKNVPTMKALENGYMAFNECAVTTNVGKVHLSFTPKITGKGQEYFTQYFLGDDHA